MGKKLVIVESPSKSKTIEKYLGSNYKVVSSKGHIRDLSTSGKYGFGVDIENKFSPTYEPIKGKKKIIDELKKEAKKCDFVYLATDPDREGEAISWHLKDAMGLKDDEYERVVFNEITKDVIKEALNNTRKIDDNLVKSQEARRILDRIIGFRLSKLMQSKTGGKSAGRVQSVALKLIVDREREIEAFKEEEYWTIKALFNDFEATLDKYNYKDIKINNELEADEILSKLSKAFKIEDVSKKSRKKKSKFPFITSTLQQEASNKLNFSAKKTMTLAQKLYEGIDLGAETTGLITYMRTDSTRLSEEFVKNAFAYIKLHYGEEYLGYVKKGKKKENVQDAHEAIRPTNISRHPDTVKQYLSNDEYKLYSLIYYRALASLMADAKVNQTTVLLDNNNYQFKTTGQTLVFDGYLKVYSEYEKSEDKELPPFDKYNSNVLIATDLLKEQHFTKPPARYSEAKLIEEMESLGIGRPSTYAKTMETLTERDYAKLIEKRFHPTEMGIEITDRLQEFFSNLINVKYTANMETALDNIALGKKVWYELLEKFYKEFEPMVKYAFDNMEKKEAVRTGEDCPECGNPLVIRKSRYGEFVSCSNYPKCKYIKNDKKEVVEIVDCPNCDGKIVEKRTRKGKIFYGCNNYPKCDFALWDKPTGNKCPTCNHLLVEKKNKIKCSSCDFEE
ncbi:MAG TPA: type I DNA topoisomerase [Mollicutes bacterium]|nr:type I DNA topoisomerase [Mollicutes bacterium]